MVTVETRMTARLASLFSAADRCITLRLPNTLSRMEPLGRMILTVGDVSVPPLTTVSPLERWSGLDRDLASSETMNSTWFFGDDFKATISISFLGDDDSSGSGGVPDPTVTQENFLVSPAIVGSLFSFLTTAMQRLLGL